MNTFKEESKIQIEAIVSECNLLIKQMREGTIERASRMLKAYVKLGYQVSSPDLVQVTKLVELQNVIHFLENKLVQTRTEEISKIEPEIAKAMSICYNRLFFITDQLFPINIKELGDLRLKIISSNGEKELKEKYDERIKYSKELYNEAKFLLGQLNSFIKVGEDLLRL